MAADFKIDGYEFELRTLELVDACKGVKMVGHIQGTIATASSDGQAFAGIVGQLPELMDLFVPYCQVRHASIAEGRRVDLKAYRGEAFNGHLDRAVLFAANCAAAEFGDFLGAGLARLGLGFADLVQRYPSLKALTPTSGA